MVAVCEHGISANQHIVDVVLAFSESIITSGLSAKRGGCIPASGAFPGNLRDALNQAGLLMPVGLFMRLEAEEALGNEGGVACWQTMNFVVETSTFKQSAGGSREGDWVLFPVANGAHGCQLSLVASHTGRRFR